MNGAANPVGVARFVRDDEGDSALLRAYDDGTVLVTCHEGGHNASCFIPAAALFAVSMESKLEVDE